jgi:hypothetical protein
MVAEGLLSDALQHSPHDSLLIERKKRLEDALTNRRQATSLLEEAQKLASAGNRALAIEKLRSARELDRTNQLIPAQLAAALIEEARVVVRHDWRAAQALIEEVFELNPGDRDAAAIALTIEDIQGREKPEQYSQGYSYEPGSKLPEATATIQASPPSDARNRFESANNWQAAAAGASASASTPAMHSLGANADGASIRSPNLTDHTYISLPAHTQNRIEPTPTLVRRASAEYRDERDTRPTRKVIAVAAALILICGALFFIWMLRGSRNLMQSPGVANGQIAQHSSTQAAVPLQSGGGSASVMPDKLPLPQAPPMNPAGKTIPFHFASSPAAAEIIVDGDQSLKCLTPCELPLRYGRHTFLMSAPKYETTQGIIEVPADRDRFVALTNDLETVHLYSQPNKMNISVDGKSEGQTPLILQLPAGEHKITSTSDASYQGAINVIRGGMNIFTISGRPAVPDRGAGKETTTPAQPHS